MIKLNLSLEILPIFEQKSLLKFPNLEECEINTDEAIEYNKIIDFKSLHKLKKFTGHLDNFLALGNTLLEKVDIYFCGFSGKEKEIKMLEKLFSIKTLKEAYFNICHLDNYDIAKIKGYNKSLIKLGIELVGDQYRDFIVYNLQKKFPNDSNLELISYAVPNQHAINLEIKENSEYNIDKLSIFLRGKRTTKLYCKSFEDLVELTIHSSNKINNIKNALPFFDFQCNKIFKKLTNLSFQLNDSNVMEFDLLENLYNNLDCFPNLKLFSIDCFSYQIDQNVYDKFILKVLKLNLESIYIKIIRNKKGKEVRYTFDEIKNIFPYIKYFNFHNIKIYKI